MKRAHSIYQDTEYANADKIAQEFDCNNQLIQKRMYKKELINFIIVEENSSIKEVHRALKTRNSYKAVLYQIKHDCLKSLLVKSFRKTGAEKIINTLINHPHSIEKVSIICPRKDGYEEVAEVFIPLIEQNKKIKNLQLKVQFADEDFFQAVQKSQSLISLKICFRNPQYNDKIEGEKTNFLESIINVAKYSKSLQHLVVKIKAPHQDCPFLLIEKAKMESFDKTGMLFQIITKAKIYSFGNLSVLQESKIFCSPLDGMKQLQNLEALQSKTDKLTTKKSSNYNIPLKIMSMEIDDNSNQLIKHEVTKSIPDTIFRNKKESDDESDSFSQLIQLENKSNEVCQVLNFSIEPQRDILTTIFESFQLSGELN
jgi:hypothetical protein